MNVSRVYIIFCAMIIGLMFFQVASTVFAETLPSSVQFKLDKCNESLNDAEAELNARNSHMAREPLRVAKDRLDSIKEGKQSKYWDHADVVAARNRYDALEKRYNEAQNKKAASAGTAEDQLKRLEKFRQFSVEGSYPEVMLASQPTYIAAKALIDEILEAGTDEHLQGYSDFSRTKMNVELWEQNRDKMIQDFIDTTKEYSKKNVNRYQEFLDKADQRVIDISKLIAADDPRIAEVKSSVDKMKEVVRQEQLEKAAKVFMSPEKYKGKDANALRALAKKAVLTKFPKASILKIKLTSSKWGPQEGGAQWTDNTYSAVEIRTNSYFSAEVAAKQGQDVMLHRVYLYKSKVNGQLQSAKSYVVGSQMMLEKNVK